ncbi:MAG: sigma-54-dependent Fis family transcriptional regulator [Halobacteriovoraceae bacterium]|nr:sigma-54-dependent Fis family transcriptional regulator [Halobacteriovoraceae bacterium]
MKVSNLNILVCDDDKYFKLALKEIVSDYGTVFDAENEATAKAILNKNHIDIALIDMEIDGPLSGIKILKSTKSQRIHSIILSSNQDESIIEMAYKGGCDHFLAKLHFRKYLRPYLQNYYKNKSSNFLDSFFLEKFITQDDQLKESISEICRVNLKNRTVLITGETGVGKSLIGELLHQQNHPNNEPFVHINCSEISESLMESELFGHTKGSFTGAINNKKGKIELATGGTLFLDEIGTMSTAMQQKLLNVIEKKEFYPIGSETPVKVEFTLITATCENLFEKITKNEFRKDLFFRISGINLDIPPLRKRVSDISFLTKHFLRKSHRRFVIKECALIKLSQYDWPGNTRELKKKVDLLSLKEKGIIDESDINLTGLAATDDFFITDKQFNFVSEHGLRAFIKNLEEDLLKKVLEQNHGKIKKTIHELKISASAFYRIFNNLKM